MSTNENAPAVADESVPVSEDNSSTTNGAVKASITYVPPCCDETLYRIIDPDGVLANYDMPSAADSRLVRAEIEQLLVDTLLDGVAVGKCYLRDWPLSVIRFNLLKALGHCSFELGWEEPDSKTGQTISHPLFKVVSLSNSTIARIIVEHDYVRMLYPSLSNSQVDAGHAGVVVHYVFSGADEGIYSPVDAGFVASLMSDLMACPAQKDIVAVEKLIRAYAATPRYQICEGFSERFVFCSNGIYDRETHELSAFSPDHVSTHKMPWPWVDDCPECRYVLRDGRTYETPLDLLSSWVTYDGGVRLLCQVAFAVVVGKPLGHLVQIFNVSGANGKSCFLGFLTSLIGESAVKMTSPVALAEDRFEVGDLAGKRLCACDDSDGNDYVNRPGRLKSIATGERIAAEQKNEPIFYLTPRCVIVIAGNNLLGSRDKSGGWVRRQLIIPFDGYFALGDRDPGIKTWAQSAEFCTWMLHYLLTEVEDFKDIMDEQPLKCAEMRNEYELENDPLKAFFDEYEGWYALTPFKAAYADYRAYLVEECPAQKNPLSFKAFVKRVREEICVEGGRFICPPSTQADPKPRRLRASEWIVDGHLYDQNCPSRPLSSAYVRGIVRASAWEHFCATGETPSEIVDIKDKTIAEIFGPVEPPNPPTVLGPTT